MGLRPVVAPLLGANAALWAAQFELAGRKKNRDPFGSLYFIGAPGEMGLRPVVAPLLGANAALWAAQFELAGRKKNRDPFGSLYFIGAPGEIRTPDRSVRSRVLYPAELRAHCLLLRCLKCMAEREGLIRSFHSLTLRAHLVRPNRLRRFVEPYCLIEGSNSESHFNFDRALCEGALKIVAEREGLIRSFHSLTLRAHLVRPNRLRRFVEPYCLIEGSNSESHFNFDRALCEGALKIVAEREGLIRSFHSLTLRAHLVRPNRLRRFVEPYCLIEGSNSESHFNFDRALCEGALKIVAEREGFEPSKGY